MTFGLSAAAVAAISIGTAAVGAGISSALGSKNQRKAAKRQNALNRQAKFIDGSLTDMAAPTEVVLEGIQGSNATGVEEAIAAMDYEAQMQGENVPIPAGMGENPMGDLSEEELMLLMESPELMGLGGGQQTQYAASGGAVGRPEDVYYFGIPQIMGMMQDPNPQIQGVGMQLADQMATMPDAGMVPATANQIQTMAMGGAVTAKKFEEGGGTSTAQSIGEGFVSNLPIIAQINALKDVREAEGLEKLVEGLDVLPVNPVKLLRNIKARKELRAELRAEEQADREREEAIVFGPQSRAMGGAVTAKKYRDGTQGGIAEGPPQTGSRTDQNLERIQQIINESGRSKLLSQLGLPDDFGRVDQDDRLLNELVNNFELPFGVNFKKEEDRYSLSTPSGFNLETENGDVKMSQTFQDENRSLQFSASPNDYGDPRFNPQYEIKYQQDLKANGGPITSERLNQLRRR